MKRIVQNKALCIATMAAVASACSDNDLNL